MYNCGIYQILNLENGNCYIGQSTNLHKRKIDHITQLKGNKHENKHLQSAWNKYGEKNFQFNIIIYCEDFELTRYEQYFSDYYKKLNQSYNIRKCVDSNKGIPCTDEAKNKMSEKQKGEKAYNYRREFSFETRQKISEQLKGRVRTEKHKENLSKSLKEKPSMLGKHHTDETKKKMSDARKKYWKENPLSENDRKEIGERLKLSNIWDDKKKKEMSEKMRGENAPNYGKSPNEETRKKISESLKKYYKNKKEKNE